jgi:hypothetical protein
MEGSNAASPDVRATEVSAPDMTAAHVHSATAAEVDAAATAAEMHAAATTTKMGSAAAPTEMSATTATMAAAATATAAPSECIRRD